MTNSTPHNIPEGLAELLRDFTISVLRQSPQDIYEFAADYFQRCKEEKRNKAVPMYIIVDDDEDDTLGEPDKHTFKPRNQRTRFARRQSIAAERFDPEADDGEEPAVYPKADEQRQRLAEAVKPILIFKCLETDQKNQVIDAMFERKVSPGTQVIRQGDDGDNFYVIESGIFEVYVKGSDGVDKKVFTFENAGSFGELALMYNQPRSATVVAAVEGTVWAMDRMSFRQIVLRSAFKKRQMYERLLETVPILQSLDAYERMNLADALTPMSFQPDECIIKEGDKADGMYFIEKGDVRVTITKNGEEVPVSSHACRYFGEMALVENAPRSASVYADTEVRLAYLERDSFERLLGPCLDIMKRHMQNYEKSS